MEPRDRAAQEDVLAPERTRRFVRRFRLLAASGVLVAIAFLQAPGQILGDTKIDLVTDPAGFLAGATQLWDPNGFLGQIQNQAYGYLFPMGPFFWIGDLLGFEPWVTQRLWWSLILVVAFLGVVKLCDVLGVGSFPAQIIGGFAYALSPRIVSTVGPASIEVWPMAVAPWVLIPLILGLRQGNPRLYAALSALAVVCVGGVNAAATFAVIPLGALWLLMADPGPRRRALMFWWPVFVLAGTLWWLIPLFVMGMVSPPFLDYIESATATTLAANLFDTLRGTSHWVPYIDGDADAGRALITEPMVILNSSVILLLGFAGLWLVGRRLGRFLTAGLLLGIVMVTAGHGAGLFDEGLRTALDGFLSPLRNTHKFDLLLRLPLVIGLVAASSHMLEVATPAEGSSPKRIERAAAWGTRHGIGVLAVAALAGSTSPAWTGGLANEGHFASFPEYWSDVGDWMNENADEQNTLILPGAILGEYGWGQPRDELVHSMAATPWTVRDGVPLAPAGHIRMLDVISDAVTNADEPEALTRYLQRSGFRYIVLRMDMPSDEYRVRLARIHAALGQAPGIQPVEDIEPWVGDETFLEGSDDEVMVRRGMTVRRPVVQVFEVEDVDSSEVREAPVTDAPVMVGDARGLYDLDETIDPRTPIVLAQDSLREAVPAEWFLTDSFRLQENAFGRVDGHRSPTLTGPEDFRAERGVHDYVTPGMERWQTVREIDGVAAISASSSSSDANVWRPDPARTLYAAFDGDERSEWGADPGRGGDVPWIEIEFDEPTDVAGTTIVLGDGQPERTVRAVTDEGVVDSLGIGGSEAIVDVPLGTTETLRLEFPGDLPAATVAEVSIPQVNIETPLRLPRTPIHWGAPDRIELGSGRELVECFTLEGVRRCDPDVNPGGEDTHVVDRIVELPDPREYETTLRARPLADQAMYDEVTAVDDFAIGASSTLSAGPGHGPLAAVDGRESTAWIASEYDTSPTLTFESDDPVTLSSVELTIGDAIAAAAPRTVTLQIDDGDEFTVELDQDGAGEFDEVEASRVDIGFEEADARATIDDAGDGAYLPVGVGELSFPGSGLDLSSVDESIALGCGSGPGIDVNSRPVRTEMTVSRQDVVDETVTEARGCATNRYRMREGENRVTVEASNGFSPRTFSMVADDAEDGADVASPSGGSIVAFAHNENPGWSSPDATAVTVEGWQQGWLIGDPADLEPRFGLQTVYRVGLGVGLIALLALVVSTVLLRRSKTDVGEEISVPPRRRLRTIVGSVATVTAALAIGGTWGLLVLSVAVAGASALRSKVAQAILAAMLLAPATITALALPRGADFVWAGDVEWTQWGVLAALGVLVVSVWDLAPRFRSRFEGFSMHR